MFNNQPEDWRSHRLCEKHLQTLKRPASKEENFKQSQGKLTKKSVFHCQQDSGVILASRLSLC